MHWNILADSCSTYSFILFSPKIVLRNPSLCLTIFCTLLTAATGRWHHSDLFVPTSEVTKTWLILFNWCFMVHFIFISPISVTFCWTISFPLSKKSSRVGLDVLCSWSSACTTGLGSTVVDGIRTCLQNKNIEFNLRIHYSC